MGGTVTLGVLSASAAVDVKAEMTMEARTTVVFIVSAFWNLCYQVATKAFYNKESEIPIYMVKHLLMRFDPLASMQMQGKKRAICAYTPSLLICLMISTTK